MNKNLLIKLVGLLATGAAVANAQTPSSSSAAPGASWTITPAVVSQYMFRGARLGGPAFQPTIEYDSGDVAAGLWASTPISDKVVGQSDPELDFYGSYTETINDSLNVVTGATFYYYPKAEPNNGFYTKTFEPYVAANYTVSGLKLTPKAYYDCVLHGFTWELSAAYAVPLKDLGTELDFLGTAGTFKWKQAADNSTPDTKNWGDYWLIGVTAPFQITKESKFSLGWAYTRGSDNFTKVGPLGKTRNPAAVGRGVVTVSYAYTF